MEDLRRAHRLTCLILAWFALAMGVAIASPLIRPQSLELICTGTGSMALVTSDAGTPNLSGHMQDCRMCVIGGAPPPAVVFAAHQQPDDQPAPALPFVVAARASDTICRARPSAALT